MPANTHSQAATVINKGALLKKCTFRGSELHLLLEKRSAIFSNAHNMQEQERANVHTDVLKEGFNKLLWANSHYCVVVMSARPCALSQHVAMHVTWVGVL